MQCYRVQLETKDGRVYDLCNRAENRTDAMIAAREYVRNLLGNPLEPLICSVEEHNHSKA